MKLFANNSTCWCSCRFGRREDRSIESFEDCPTPVFKVSGCLGFCCGLSASSFGACAKLRMVTKVGYQYRIVWGWFAAWILAPIKSLHSRNILEWGACFRNGVELWLKRIWTCRDIPGLFAVGLWTPWTPELVLFFEFLGPCLCASIPAVIGKGQDSIPGHISGNLPHLPKFIRFLRLLWLSDFMRAWESG